MSRYSPRIDQSSAGRMVLRLGSVISPIGRAAGIEPGCRVLIAGESRCTRSVPSIPMPRLVAVRMRGGPVFVDAIRRIWDRGDAVAPLDASAPDAFTARALEVLAADAILDGDGEEHALDGGRPTEEGDAVVILTSGTGGDPKAAVLTHHALESSAYMTATS